ncbi:MAG TPA: Ku protein [Egibacteraceae bacterium]|nr:Ku protein [Egibacteraceae bacterium]
MPPRSLWKGALSFGLVNVPVRLYTATDDKTPSFNQLRASDHSRIGYKRVAKADDQEVDYDDIVKGYEYERDRYVVFTPEELEAMKPPSSRTIEILQFTPLEQIDPIYFQRAYYLAPDPSGAKAYALLAQAMKDRKTVALCKVAIRDKEHLATLRLRDDVMVLETMWWPDEIREVSLADFDIDELPEPRKQEVQMAQTLIENLTEDFDPSQFSDTYRERVMEAVKRKVEGEEITIADEGEEPAAVVDLMAALKQSVEASKSKRGGDKQPKAAEKDDKDEDKPKKRKKAS